MSRSVAETVEEETCASSRSASSGRVRNLARRFERTSSRSPNSFRKAQRRRLGQLTVDNEKCIPPQKPTRLHLGLYRRKSSIKKKSKSHLDVVSADSESPFLRQKSVRKSRSNNESLSDYLRSLSHEMYSQTEQTKTVHMQLRIDDNAGVSRIRTHDRDNTKEASMKIVTDDTQDAQYVHINDATRSLTQNPPTTITRHGEANGFGGTVSTVSKRTPGAKPLPPTKPDRLRTANAATRTASLEAPRKACEPPSVLPKSAACMAAFANASSLVQQNREKRSSSVTYSLDSAVELDDSPKAHPSDSSAPVDPVSRSAEVDKTVLERSSSAELDPILSKTAQTQSAKRIPCSITHSTEEIKKPTMKPPPPPPKSTFSPRPESNVLQDCSRRNQVAPSCVQQPKCEVLVAEITRSDDEVTHIVMTSPTSSNSGDFYQKMPSPAEALEDRMFTIKSPRFQRKCTSADEIPRVPSIPPPSPPKLSPHSSLDDDDLYEEIEHVISFRETCSDAEELMERSRFECDDSIYAMDSLPASSSMQEMDVEYGEGCSAIPHMPVDILTKSTCADGSDHTNAKKKHSIGTLSLRKKPSSTRRPMSTLEFDKLLRIKSDIQLNITKKVGQIKLKVTSAAQEKQRRERSTSMFYVNPNELKTDENVVAQIEFPLDEECIYGDDWSSDEEDDDQHSQTNETNEGDKEKVEISSSIAHEPSMLSEIERELNIKLSSNCLPDVVPKSEAKPASHATMEQTKESDEIVEVTNKQGSGSSAFFPRAGCDSSEESKNQKSKGAPSGHEATISSPSSPEKNYGVPTSPSDYTLNDVDRIVYTPRFLPEPQPLYQIYMMEQQQHERLIFDPHEHDEGVTMLLADGADKDLKIRRNSSSASTDSGRGADCSTTVSHMTSNTSMRRERLVAASHFGSQRSLWCELPEVKNAGLLETLSDEEKKLQEAFFEVITSEASYLRSLNILITHFMAAPEMLGSKGTSSVISNEERKHLFSNIFSVRDCSERLLCDLESRLEESLVLTDVCDILCEHFETNFDAYVKYCSNQVYQDRTLKRLKCYNSAFMSCIQRLESDRQCQGLDMRSFLMLPMQRVTRYPLLVIAILDRIPTESEQHKTAQMALHFANHVVNCCNEGARRMERTEQLLEIERRLVYKSPDLRRIPLVSSGRYLVKRGSLMHLTDSRPKNLLQSRQHSRNIYVFLFSDILMITKKKLNGTFVCKDYSARRFVDIEPVEVDSPKVPPAAISVLATKPHLFICTLMHNARGRQTELLLNAESESDRERWLSALRPPTVGSMVRECATLAGVGSHPPMSSRFSTTMSEQRTIASVSELCRQLPITAYNRNKSKQRRVQREEHHISWTDSVD
uniref:DH domain-containing protein n=3 Tax=Parascaris univalens TaxID=6257 RepID=A0A915ARH7_PARUN